MPNLTTGNKPLVEDVRASSHRFSVTTERKKKTLICDSLETGWDNEVQPGAPSGLYFPPCYKHNVTTGSSCLFLSGTQRLPMSLLPFSLPPPFTSVPSLSPPKHGLLSGGPSSSSSKGLLGVFPIVTPLIYKTVPLPPSPQSRPGQGHTHGRGTWQSSGPEWCCHDTS